jgi:hypothetical protein
MGTIPSVSFQKIDGQTGSTPTDPTGILAIIAAGSSGSYNQPSGFSVDTQVWASYGPSPLAEDASYCINVGQNTVIPIRATTSGAAAAIGDITKVIAGTCVPTAHAGAAPVDVYSSVLVKCITGGTVGVAGIQLQASLDGGNSFLPVQNLGVATTFTVGAFAAGGSPGVAFDLPNASTLAAGDYWSAPCTPAQVTDADVAVSLEALRVSTLPWEGVLIDEVAGTGTTGLVDAFLSGIELVGKFRYALVNLRMKNQAALESEATYAAAMQAQVATQAPSIRLVEGADGANVTSTITGFVQPRPTSLFIAADAMAIPIGQDPAWVDAGSIANCVIVGPGGVPAFHNEELYPNLDQLLLSTLRSVAGKGANAVYITNARVFDTVGSDYVFLQHIRTMNRACEIAFGILSGCLGRGVGKKPADPVTGGVYMADEDRLSIDAGVNGAVRKALVGQVVAYAFTLNQNDDIGSNSGAFVTGKSMIVSKAYIKGIKVIAGFTRSISVPLS